MKNLAVLISLMFATTGVAHAGTIYTMVETIGSAKKILLSVQGHSLRTDEQSESTMIFNGNAGQVVAVDHDERSYIVLDRERIAATMEQLNPALEQMRKQLENLPPDQRAMVEKMMGKKMPTETAARPQSEIRNTGESGEHAGIDCEWHTVEREGVVQQRMCMADPGDIRGSREALATMRQMASFVEDVLAPLRAQLPVDMGENPMANLGKLDGFPIITQRLSNGSVESDLRLENAAEAELDANTFAPPAEYTEREMTGR